MLGLFRSQVATYSLGNLQQVAVPCFCCYWLLLPALRVVLTLYIQCSTIGIAVTLFNSKSFRIDIIFFCRLSDISKMFGHHHIINSSWDGCLKISKDDLPIVVVFKIKFLCFVELSST